MMQRTENYDVNSLFTCTVCRSILRSVEPIPRSDGNVLQLVTCTECNHRWKELWTTPSPSDSGF